MLYKAIPVRVPVGQMEKLRHLRESCLPCGRSNPTPCPVGTKLTRGTSSSCGFSKLSHGYLLVLPIQTYLSLSNCSGPAANVQFLTLQRIWGRWFISLSSTDLELLHTGHEAFTETSWVEKLKSIPMGGCSLWLPCLSCCMVLPRTTSRFLVVASLGALGCRGCMGQSWVLGGERKGRNGHEEMGYSLESWNGFEEEWNISFKDSGRLICAFCSVFSEAGS